VIAGATFPGAVFVANLWWYAFAVLRPAQALKAAGVYRGREIGAPPAPLPHDGRGPHYSLAGAGPVLLDRLPSVHATVEAFDRASAWHDQVQAPFSAPIFEDVSRTLASLATPADRILDCSCGGGTEALALARLVPEGEVVGADLSGEMVSAAAERARESGAENLAFFQADVANMPSHFGGQFDFVYCSFSFHHYTEPVVALREIRRVLAPAGRLLVVDAGPWWMKAIGSPIAKLADPGWVAFYTGEELASLFAEAGFTSFYWTEVLPGIGLAVGGGEPERMATRGPRARRPPPQEASRVRTGVPASETPARRRRRGSASRQRSR
jgi:SAM-dependent methyltransferase